MDMKIFKYLFIFAIAISASSCNNDDLMINTRFDEPFIYIESEDGTRETRLGDNVSDEKTYYFYMSTEELDHEVEVWYDIVVGNGLVEGVDYEISPSSTNPVKFNPGRYTANMRIIWKSHAIDPLKDNTLRIVPTRNSENFTFGFPGPDKNNAEHVITKFSTKE
jgi:hypothetical protein